MAPRKAKTTSVTLNMTQTAIRKLVKNSIAKVLVVERAVVAARAAETAPQIETSGQASNGTNGRKCTYKDFKSGDPIKFKGTEGTVAMIHWFEHTKYVYHLGNCPEEAKVKFVASTLLDEAMPWWNSYTELIGKDNAYKLTWDEFKNLLTKEFCPCTKVKKLEFEFYGLVTLGMTLRHTSEGFTSWLLYARLWFLIMRSCWKTSLVAYLKTSVEM